MLTVLQRVSRASVRVDGGICGEIGLGAVLLVCVEAGDRQPDADSTASKIASLRFFPGEHGMDLSLSDVGGACLVVSQFTLTGKIRKGRRPSFTDAAPANIAEELYQRVVEQLRASGIEVATGEFAAKMEIDMLADGPVTLLIASKEGKIL